MRYNYKPAEGYARHIARERVEECIWGHPAGLERLGSGCYGVAHLLPDGKVLKVSLEFDGTAAWINEAASIFRDTGKPGAFMPEVYAFGVGSVEGSSYWWAVMERVTPANKMDDYNYFPCMDEVVMIHGKKHELDDCHSGNWGYAVKDGRMVLFDPSTSPSSVLDPVLPTVAAIRNPPKLLRGPAHARGRWAQ